MQEPAATQPIDPLARSAAIAIALARVGLGAAICARTPQALTGLGFDRPAPATVALARLAGGRDIGLGLHGLAGVNDRPHLRQAVAIGALVDLGDAIAFGAGLGAVRGHRRTALINALVAGAATLAGAWVYNRL